MPEVGGQPEILIEPLAAKHARGAFSCGEDYIDAAFLMQCLDVIGAKAIQIAD